MRMARKLPLWEPSPEFKAGLPPVTGNAVNGLGEATPRRPTPIFWHRPEREAHGKLQERIVTRFNAVPELNKAYFDRDARGPRMLPEVSPEGVDRPPDEWVRTIKDFALANASDLVGITRYDPQWTFAGYDVPTEPWIVVLGVAMDHARLSEVVENPDNHQSAIEVAEKYNRGAFASRTL